MGSEVMMLDIHKLGSWSHLWCPSHLQCSTVVFKDLSADLGGVGPFDDLIVLQFLFEVGHLFGPQGTCGTSVCTSYVIAS